jgi:hypothetical protein
LGGVTINSVLTGNTARSPSVLAEGGGIYLSVTNGVVEGTTVTGNQAIAGTISRGGGIGMFGLPSNTLAIRDSVITENSAQATSSFGGGVSILSGAATVDDDSVIAGNTAAVGPDVFGVLTVVPD